MTFYSNGLVILITMLSSISCNYVYAAQLDTSTGRVVFNDSELAYLKMLQSESMEKYLCQGMVAMFGVDNSFDCSKGTTFHTKDLQFKVYIADQTSQEYDLEIIGNSSRMSLHQPDWIEQHRIKIWFALDSQLTPYYIIWDWQSMVSKSTPNIDQLNEDTMKQLSIDQQNQNGEPFQNELWSRVKHAVEIELARHVEGTVK